MTVAPRMPRKRRKPHLHRREQWRDLPAVFEEDQLLIGGWQVMQRWEAPLMSVLAREVTVHGGDTLEIGFGMGIAANEIMARGCRTYTVIEAHPEVAARARAWGREQRMQVTVLEGFWQDIEPALATQFDGILFDSFPLSRRERGKNHFPFIPRAPRLLRPGGVLTLFSDETVNFRSAHLRLLLSHFDEVKLLRVDGLKPPVDCVYWKDTTMVIPVATKRALHF